MGVWPPRASVKVRRGLGPGPPGPPGPPAATRTPGPPGRDHAALADRLAPPRIRKTGGRRGPLSQAHHAIWGRDRGNQDRETATPSPHHQLTQPRGASASTPGDTAPARPSRRPAGAGPRGTAPGEAAPPERGVDRAARLGSRCLLFVGRAPLILK